MHKQHRTSIVAALAAAVIIAFAGPSASASIKSNQTQTLVCPTCHSSSPPTAATNCYAKLQDPALIGLQDHALAINQLVINGQYLKTIAVKTGALASPKDGDGVSIGLDANIIESHGRAVAISTNAFGKSIKEGLVGGQFADTQSASEKTGIGTKAFAITGKTGIGSAYQFDYTTTANINGVDRHTGVARAITIIGFDVNNLGFGSCGVAAPTGPPIVSA